MGAFAEFERSLLRERQRKGIALVRQRGACGGRKRSLSADQVTDMTRRIYRTPSSSSCTACRTSTISSASNVVPLCHMNFRRLENATECHAIGLGVRENDLLPGAHGRA